MVQSISLVTALANGPVEVVFTKVDGSRRTMLATTNPALFNADASGVSNTNTSYLITVWDLMNDGWRSIRPHTVVSWTVQ